MDEAAADIAALREAVASLEREADGAPAPFRSRATFRALRCAIEALEEELVATAACERSRRH